MSCLFAGWEADLALWDRNGAPPRRAAPIRAGVILPENSPAPLLNTIAAASLRNVDLCLKPARSDLDFVRELVGFVDRHLEDLRIDVVTELDLSRCDRLVVFGRDETVALFRERFGREADFFGFGRRFSVAYVEATTSTTAALAARDVAAWNQNGCLSPQTFFVTRRLAEGFASELARELTRLEESAPRGGVSTALAHRIRVLRADGAVRETGRVFAPPAGTAWTVLYDSLAGIEETPLERTVWVRAVDDWSAVENLLRPDIEHLEAVGFAGADSWRDTIVASLGGDPDRVLAIGTMQSPRLSRCHGGRPPLVLSL